MGFDMYDWRDKIAIFTAALLIILGVLSYFGIIVPQLALIVAALFILGGVIGFLDAFEIYSMGMKSIYMILFVLVIALGVNAFVAIPYVSGLFSILPVNITHYVVNGIVAIALIAVAFQS